MRVQEIVAEEFERRPIIHLLQGDEIGIRIANHLSGELALDAVERGLGDAPRLTQFLGIPEFDHADATIRGAPAEIQEFRPGEKVLGVEGRDSNAIHDQRDS